VEPYFRKFGKELRYIGRAEAASPATGSPKTHKKQQQAIIEAAFNMSLEKGADFEQ
jgi:2-oxoglutarate dehydrogenase E1 component